MKTIEEVIESARDIYGDAEEDEKVIDLLEQVAIMAKNETRAKLIYRGEELAGMYLDGPLRDSVYALFNELKTIEL